MSSLALFAQAIARAEDSFSALADCPVEFKREQQFALQICNSNTYLQQERFLGSLCNAVRNVALCGITLNPVMKLAYLVPRDKAICLDISYMGLIKIATDSGSVTKVSCQAVYEKDVFEVSYGTQDAVIHKPLVFGDRGNPIGVYCIATLHDGSVQIETMSIKEINEIRGRSSSYKKGNSSPWRTDYLEMARKTCVKRASKYWNKSERLANAVQIDHDNNGNAAEHPVSQETIQQEEPCAATTYPDADFKVNFPKWQRVIETGRKTADDIIAMVNTKAALSDEQQRMIRAVAAPIDVKEVAA